MYKSMKLLSLIGVSAAFLGAQPGAAQYRTPAYFTTMYSDASYTAEVGYRHWRGCDPSGQPIYQLTGTHTYYQQDELVGYCGENGMEPVS